MSHFNSTIQNMRLSKVKIFDHNINCPAISQVLREVSSKIWYGNDMRIWIWITQLFFSDQKELVREEFFRGLLIQLPAICWEKIWKSVHCQGFFFRNYDYEIWYCRETCKIFIDWLLSENKCELASNQRLVIVQQYISPRSMRACQLQDPQSATSRLTTQSPACFTFMWFLKIAKDLKVF